MKQIDTPNQYSISTATLRNWYKLGYIQSLDNISNSDLESILHSKTTSRRNKQYNLSRFIPRYYVQNQNIPSLISQILVLQNDYGVSNYELLIEAILAILKGRNIPKEIYMVLGKRSCNFDFTSTFQGLDFSCCLADDFLGCLYMSLLSIGQKDKKGIFYTPHSITAKIIDTLDFSSNIKILDPGCGSGNFLIQAYQKMKQKHFSTEEILSTLHGFDIDPIAVLLAKINIYSLDNAIDFSQIHITTTDFLLDSIPKQYDIIIGNPPWGKKYTKSEKIAIQKKYNESFTKLDSFSQFILRSLELLKSNGIFSFVLPSSIQNINKHQFIRDVMLSYDIVTIQNIGREFEEIVTDVIIITVKNSKSFEHICQYNEKKVLQQSFLDNPLHTFLISDQFAKEIIRKMQNYPSYHLDNPNIKYSIGIVTGNNKKKILKYQEDGTEPIISGKNISKYNFDYTQINKFIKFKNQTFQQVAPEENYRKEKIVYKFIGSKLCFAVETKGLLTLNSANIINIPDKDLYYISAILNSRVTQLYFDNIYHTHKVLKNDIQSLFIFDFDSPTQTQISNLAQNSFDNCYNEEIEDTIYQHLNLSIEEIQYLKKHYP